jgi:hypothetical protein
MDIKDDELFNPEEKGLNELKHKELFEELKITHLYPPKDIYPIEIIGYRWVFSPIENNNNFLPNYSFDKSRNNIKNYSNGKYNDEDKQKRCSQSFYDNLASAKINHKKISQSMREKLGYTHIAEGQFDKSDGYATATNSIGHFSFYECYLCDLKSKFKICDSLN